MSREPDFRSTLASLWFRMITLGIIALVFSEALLLAPGKTQGRTYYLTSLEVAFEVAVLLVAAALAGVALGTVCTAALAPSIWHFKSSPERVAWDIDTDTPLVIDTVPSPQTGRGKNSSSGTGFERFLAVWQDSKAASPARRLTVFFAGLALICGATALIGVVPTRIYGHDVFVWLAGGWRAINGQRPHVDFTSPFGPVMFLVSGLGPRISRHSANGIGYGSAIVALIVGIWSFLLGKNRLASSPRIMLSLFLAALVASPYPLGLTFVESSHAMLYNRYGYGLLGIILLVGLKLPRGGFGSRKNEWIGGISTGAALSLTLFLKVSYFLVAFVLIVFLAWFLGRLARQRVLGIILGFLLVSVSMLAYLRLDAAAMIGDLRMAAAARTEPLKFPFWIIFHQWPVLLTVGLFGAAAALLLGNRIPQWRGLKLPILGALFFVADVGLIRTNAQSDGYLVCAVFAILVLSEITEDQQALPATERQSCRPAYAAVLSLGALLFVPQFVSDLGGLAYGLWQKERPSNQGALLRFTSPNLKPLLLYDVAGNPPGDGRMFTTYVNDGVALLGRETSRNETILSMDATNPFPYALERQPPRGGHAALMYHFNIDDGHRPSDNWYFADADVVMVPKRPSGGGDNRYIDFYKAYESGLKQRYYLAAESDLWWMYRRTR